MASDSDSLFLQGLHLAQQYPFSSTIIAFLTIAFVQRVVSELQYRRLSSKGAENNVVPILPYSMPLLGHAIPLMVGAQDYLVKIGHTRDAVSALNVAGYKFNLITAPSITKQILLQPTKVMTGDPALSFFLKAFFGDQGATEKVGIEKMWNLNHRTMNMLMRHPWLSSASDEFIQELEKRVPNLVTLDSSTETKRQSWEQHCNIKSVENGSAVETDLAALIRSFVGTIALPSLTGRDFLRNNPNWLEDHWYWDSYFGSYLTGMPHFLPPLRKASAARQRMMDQIEEWQDAVLAYTQGEKVAEKWTDLSDVPTLMVERIKGWRELGVPVVARTANDIMLIWGLLINTNAVAMWILFHIYSTPSLLRDVRSETSPYVARTPSQPLEHVKIDITSLLTSAPLLKATTYEVMRHYVQTFSFKVIKETTTVSESPEDAAIHGRPGAPQTFTLPKGEIAMVTHFTHQTDARYWPEPQAFRPERFLVPVEKDDKDKQGRQIGGQHMTASMKTMHPFGGGVSMCKGRAYAERELLSIVASVIQVWDMDMPGGWKHPGSRPAGGSAVPKRDVRVVIRRRQH